MDGEPAEKSLLFTILDILLIVGAIFCVLTIDRGQWLISNPAFYQESEDMQMAFPVPPVEAMPIPLTGEGGCPTEQAAGYAGQIEESGAARGDYNPASTPQAQENAAAAVGLCGG